MKGTIQALCVVLSLHGGALAQEDAPALGKVWAETVLADPERAAQTGRGLTALPATAYRFEDGAYQSIVSRIALRLPRLGTERVVSVREAVVFRRPDGQTVTSHVIFVPGPLGMTTDSDAGVSAVVVTRLRDDRPKDRDSVLKGFEPRSEAERSQYESAGISHTRVPTELGEAVQRVVPDRTPSEPFPYRTQIQKTDPVRTVGVSRFIVVEGDSLIEFSQVFPCGSLGADACKAQAIAASDRFVAGVRKFLTYPAGSK